MSCRSSSKRVLVRRCSILRRVPVKKLSTHSTSTPSASRRSQRCEPRNPEPPVTSTRSAICRRITAVHGSGCPTSAPPKYQVQARVAYRPRSGLPSGPYGSALEEVPFEEAGIRFHLEPMVSEHSDQLAVLLIRRVLVVLHGNPLDTGPIGRVEVAQDLVFGALAVELQVIDGFQPVLVHDAAERYLRDGHALAPARIPDEQSCEQREARAGGMRHHFKARIGHQLH